MNNHEFAAGAVIFRVGDPGTRAYLIHTGNVELLRGGADHPVRLALLGPGEVFGEMSLVEERPHSLTARAVRAVVAEGMTRDEFERALTADPAKFRVYLRALFERLRTMAAQAGSLALAGPVCVAPSVSIHPLTRRAAATLPIDGLTVTKFPFRIGRADQQHEWDAADLNDLWLIDQVPFNVSRTHAQLDLQDGAVVIRDRGSRLGIYVNEQSIGGASLHWQSVLEDGDNVVILGGSLSPYQFRVHVEHSKP